MTQDGFAYEHPMSGHRITETDGSRYAMPTPVRAMEAPNKRSNSKGPKNLVEIAQGKWDHFWPTPTCNMVSGGPNHNSPQVIAGRHGLNLSGAVQMFPTPNASDHRDRGNMSMPSIQRRAAIGKQLNLSMVVHPTSGKLNPEWVEWLMGWPIGHTASKQLETVKSHSKSQSHLPPWLKA